MPIPVTDRRFSRFAVIVLGYNVFVVLLGAVVRATESGAGCGADWPTCRGEILPLGAETKTLIEFAHRATAGVALVLVVLLALWALRTRPRGDAARWMAVAAGVLIFNEALIGAALVLFEWVADDESIGRAVSIVVHLVNTFLLLGALTLTAWFGSGKAVPSRPFPLRERRLLRLGLIGLLVVGAMGAITALGDTLFPPESVGDGFFDDLAGGFIVRLRWIHPVLAVMTAGFLLWMVRALSDESGAAQALRGFVYLQVAVGMINVVLLAPTWMQVIHLLLADAVWISFVLFGTLTLTARKPVTV